MARLALALVASITLLHPSARADVVGPPPSDCPEGTAPVTGHCSVCAPDTCASDADCESGEVCRERSYCTRVYETCGGWGGPGATDARPTCGGGEACPPDAPCTATRVCVRSSDSDGGGGREIVRYGCGCRIGDRKGPGLGALVGLGAVALAVARRARERARRACALEQRPGRRQARYAGRPCPIGSAKTTRWR